MNQPGQCDPHGPPHPTPGLAELSEGGWDHRAAPRNTDCEAPGQGRARPPPPGEEEEGGENSEGLASPGGPGGTELGFPAPSLLLQPPRPPSSTAHVGSVSEPGICSLQGARLDKSDPQSFQSGLDMVWRAGGSRLSHTMVVRWQTLVFSEGREFTGRPGGRRRQGWLEPRSEQRRRGRL